MLCVASIYAAGLLSLFDPEVRGQGDSNYFCTGLMYVCVEQKHEECEGVGGNSLPSPVL